MIEVNKTYSGKTTGIFRIINIVFLLIGEVAFWIILYLIRLM